MFLSQKEEHNAQSVSGSGALSSWKPVLHLQHEIQLLFCWRLSEGQRLVGHIIKEVQVGNGRLTTVRVTGMETKGNPGLQLSRDALAGADRASLLNPIKC